MNQTNNTLTFSPLIIGMMRFGVWGVDMNTNDLEKFIDQCIALGLTDFDHADIYGHYTEEGRFGQVIKRRPDLKSKIQITTKCGIRLVTPNRPGHKIASYNSTKSHIIASTEQSLKELGVEQLDVLLIHRPDYLMKPAEIAEAVEQLKKQGKINHFGVSNFTSSQFELLHSYTPLVTNQIEVSILHRQPIEDGTLDQCMRLGAIPTAWSPFGGGALFVSKSNKPAIQRITDAAQPLQEKYTVTFDQLLLAWLLKHPSGIIPVLGTTKIARIEKAKEALAINLSHEDWYILLEAAVGEQVP